MKDQFLREGNCQSLKENTLENLDKIGKITTFNVSHKYSNC
jgi:hypothetical protein